MTAPFTFSQPLQAVILLAKKTAVALGKNAQKIYHNAIPVEGWELLNALYTVQPVEVKERLEPILRERQRPIHAIPWVDVDSIDDRQLHGQRFRIVTPANEDYLTRAQKKARGGTVEIVHLLDALFAELDNSLQRILEGRSHYQQMRDFLRSRIFGQDATIDSLLEGLKVSHLRLNEEKPFSFALLGPTGVGKTELVKQLARFLFGREQERKFFLCINLSRFQMDTAHELIFGGSPYKGQPTEGLLYPFLKQFAAKNPGTANDYVVSQRCIILLDEIEKAHHSTFMAFLSMLDEGLVETIHRMSHVRFHLTSKTLIFLTSNAGQTLYEDVTIGSRFLQNAELIKQALQQESRWTGASASDHQHDPALVPGFRPEFLSRIDMFCMFSKLQPSHMEKIAELNLRELADRIKSFDGFKQIHNIEFDEDLATLFAFKDGFQYGVRNLRTLIETTLIPPLISYADENPMEGLRSIRFQLEDCAFKRDMCVNTQEIRVLAIDDPADLIDPDDYRNHFKDLEFAWDSASSVSDALNLLKSNQYLFVLMDMHQLDSQKFLSC